MCIRDRAETLRSENVAARIVFVTSNTELSMAVRGYEVQALSLIHI